MARRILCVAEKPSIAKAVANHLGGGQVTTRAVNGNQYVKNYEFNCTLGPPWGNSIVTMTSVLGHLTELEFQPQYKGWKSCPPSALFDAPVSISVAADKLAISKNIESQARYANGLFIWTDCDREGEHIGGEIRDVALKSNHRLDVKRAKFSNIERAHVLQAAQRPEDLDQRQVNAVAARLELDLRIGAAFTRMQTLNLQPLGSALEEGVISYGSCQFPTLGFVVDRYFRVKNFIPEPFWRINVMHRKDGVNVNFSWNRVKLFDRMATIIFLERCLNAKSAKVTKVQQKPTSKWRPLPLTTVELQKMGSRFLRMDSQTVMTVAEKLYNLGFISYPRTETDQFDKGMDLKKLVEKQIPSPQWGTYAQGLLDGNFQWPRGGRNNDQAHPPIHPVTFVAANSLENNEQRRVYEFVVRRFLACCSEDAKGESTTVEIEYGDELFHSGGLIVRERNYLDVYPYDKWESSQAMPDFRLGERFEPTEAKISDGKTVAPGYLTEPDLIALMDANGIGTDATMAEHIAKIKARKYVTTRPRGGGQVIAEEESDSNQPASRNQGARGRGRGRGGGASSSRSTTNSGMQEFIPTTLGVALVEGYDKMNFATSLSKPFLRKEMELSMKDICAGAKTKNDVVHESVEQYREVFIKASQQIDVLKNSCRRYVIDGVS